MSRPSRVPAIDVVLDRAVAERRIPGAVAILTDRRGVLFESARGLSSTRENAPMKMGTVFRIASMTKPITSIAILMLAEERKLTLDDTLAKHVPGFETPPVLLELDERTGRFDVRRARREVTIRDLLTHTSGFGYWFLDRELLIEADGRVDYFNAPFLMHEPGERFSYGIGTDVLGRIFEPLTGITLERFFETRIFEPLGMVDTHFGPPADAARLAGLHTRSADGFEDPPNETEGEPPRGGGGLYSTVRDYGALLRMLLSGGRTESGGRLLSESAVAQMTSNQIGGRFAGRQCTAYPPRTLDFAFLDGTHKFGFNLMIETRSRPGRRSAGSWGWAGIFNTYFWGDPVLGIGAVLMMQVSPFCDPECLGVLDELEAAVYTAVAG